MPPAVAGYYAVLAELLFDIFTVALKTIYNVSLKYYYFEGILQVLKFEFEFFVCLKF